jgi:hypothetical protein
LAEFNKPCALSKEFNAKSGLSIMASGGGKSKLSYRAILIDPGEVKPSHCTLQQQRK